MDIEKLIEDRKIKDETIKECNERINQLNVRKERIELAQKDNVDNRKSIYKRVKVFPKDGSKTDDNVKYDLLEADKIDYRLKNELTKVEECISAQNELKNRTLGLI